MTGWAVETALEVSLLITVVLLVRRPVAAAFGAHAAYALWLAPLVRAVVPPISFPTVAPPAASVGDTARYVILSVTPPGNAAMDWPFALGVGWLAGAALFAAWHLWRHHCFITTALQGGHPVEVPGMSYDVIASPAIEGPMATGLTHPLILVPSDFGERFTAEQQRIALCHEAMHHRRGDMWASAAALLIASALWFNPLAHFALGALRRDMEASCDASVLSRLGRPVAATYAETILRCAIRPVPRSLCALTSIDELKGRLMMLGSNVGSLRRLAGLGLAGALAASGVALAAAPEKQERVETRKFEKKVVIHSKGTEPGDIEEVDRLPLNCPGEKFEVGTQGGSAGKKQETHFIICTDPGESLLPALEKAVTDIEREELEIEGSKAEILAKLRAKIAELRAKG